MKQSKFNKAYPAILRLSKFKLPIAKARAIYNISNKMRDHFEFALIEEQKYMAECHGTMNHDGTVKFSTQEDFRKFQDRIEELNGFDVIWDCEPVTLTEADIGSELISVSDIRDLEGFVIFN